jgi:acyl-CoA synthetase (NDP forming)
MSFMEVIVEHGFPGNVYPVNHRGGEVLGHKAYTSVRDIPGPVDYAFLQVPAKATIEVIRDCGVKGVKLAAFFTAGFGESEIKGGSELEQELLRVARQGGVRLLGPNCMGFYCPAARLSFAYNLPQESGPVGALCQSGGHSGHLVRAGAQRGIRFSKVISYGNAIDLNEAELLEYFAEDPETKIIIVYIEGVRQGVRFFQALRTATRAKPVIVFKGGRQEAGVQAALSHTGSLAGSAEVWDSLLKQAGAIQAYTIDECVDIALAFRFMVPPRSRRTAVIGGGGGATVQAADECSSAGLILPPLPNEIKDELKKFLPVAGNIFKNPVDMSGVHSFQTIAQSIKLVGDWSEVDLIITHIGVEIGPDAMMKKNLLEPVADVFIRATKEVGKPAALVAYAFYTAPACLGILKVQQMCCEAGLPFYPSIQRAANAIDKLIRYYHAR